MRRVDYKIFEKDIDSLRNEYCLNLAMADALKTVELNYDIEYDLGEYEPLPLEWIDEEDFIEPVPAIKDVFSTQSVNSNNIRNEALPNLYVEISHQSQKAYLEKRAILKDLQQYRKGHLITKHGSANVVGSVGEPWASEGVIQLRNPRLVEADDEIAQKIREEKHQQRLRLERMERDAKDKVVRDKQRTNEIENLNKELERGNYTYDFQGNIIIQNSQVVENIPSDFKFKYRFKRGRKKKDNSKYNKALPVPFKDNKATGYQPSDYNKLSKMVDQKGLINLRQTAGSMFDFFKPPDAGVAIREDKKYKQSKKDFEEITGKMSLDLYQKKVNADGNFQSNMIHPELQMPESQNEFLDAFNRSKLLQTLAFSLKTDLTNRVQEYKEKEDYISKIREDHQTKKRVNEILNEKHQVRINSPDQINHLIVIPEKKKMTSSVVGLGLNQTNRSSMINNNANQTLQSQKALGLSKNQSLKILPQNYQQMQKPVKNIEITSDLHKLKKENMMQYETQTMKSNEMQQLQMFQELNGMILLQSGWGQNNEGLPSLMKESQSQKNTQSNFQNFKMNSKKANNQTQSQTRIGTAQTAEVRPFSRTLLQSSQQSMRATLTTANSNTRTVRRNILSLKCESTLQHLPQPPLGKTLGHGLFSLKSNSVVPQTDNNIKGQMTDQGMSSQNSTVRRHQKQNANHLFNMIGVKSTTSKGKQSFGLTQNLQGLKVKDL